MRMTAKTAVRTMERPLRVTDLITFNRVSSLCITSSSCNHRLGQQGKRGEEGGGGSYTDCFRDLSYKSMLCAKLGWDWLVNYNE